MAKSSKKGASKKGSGKRTTIAPNNDKRYVKRDAKGRIRESDDQGKSLSQDVKKSAKKKVKSGYGDQGDQAKKSASKKSASKKSASKKSASKKSATKKSATKKSASKKSASRKSAPKKAASKRGK